MSLIAQKFVVNDGTDNKQSQIIQKAISSLSHVLMCNDLVDSDAW